MKDTSPWLVPPICAFVSWVLFVTEEIGHVIEEPFGNGLSRDPDDPAVAHPPHPRLYVPLCHACLAPHMLTRERGAARRRLPR